MIVTQLAGGLGNQLFMYATAKALALRLNTELILDVYGGFINDKKYKRNYGLDSFNLKYKQNNILTYNYPFGDVVKKTSRLIGRNLFAPSYSFLCDNTNNKGFDKRIMGIKNRNVYLEGYWQSEKYFDDQEIEIRNSLYFEKEIQKSQLDKERNIFHSDNIIPICVGVRRYQECKERLPFDILDEKYYIEAINYMRFLVPGNLVFYVFTQNKEWVKEKIIKNVDCKMIIVDEGTPVEDLFLMSKFRFHIISNSSFYWWGAWLAKGNIVISTDKFINKYSNLDNWKVIKTT